MCGESPARKIEGIVCLSLGRQKALAPAEGNEAMCCKAPFSVFIRKHPQPLVPFWCRPLSIVPRSFSKILSLPNVRHLLSVFVLQQRTILRKVQALHSSKRLMTCHRTCLRRSLLGGATWPPDIANLSERQANTTSRYIAPTVVPSRGMYFCSRY
jgi:hypothetical protein